MGKIRKPAKKVLTKDGECSIVFQTTGSCYYYEYEDAMAAVINPDEFKPLAEYLLKCDAYLKQQKKEKK